MSKSLPYHDQVCLKKENLTVRELIAIIADNQEVPIAEILKEVRNGDLLVYLVREEKTFYEKS